MLPGSTFAYLYLTELRTDRGRLSDTGAQSHRGKYWCLTGAGLGDVGFVVFILAPTLLTPSSLKH